MRAISVIQPWASRFFVGGKTIETRTHDGLRGCVGHRIAIHASGHKSCGDVYDLQDVCETLALLYKDKEPERAKGMIFRDLFGVVLGTVEAYAFRELCHADEEAAQCSIGNNRFGLFVRDPKPFAKPITAKGRLGVWEWQEAES